jgi:hypothetical protein
MDLAAARSRLRNAINHRDANAEARAADIRDGIDDGVADSRWADVVDKYAWLINDICTALEVVATALTVVALLIPGLNVIVIAAISATALALIGRTMLAAAGDGSWIDVALDVFALGTFGLGKTGNLTGRAADLVQNNPLTKTLVSVLDQAGFGRLGEGLTGLTEKTSGFLGKVSAATLERVSPSLEKTLAGIRRNSR